MQALEKGEIPREIEILTKTDRYNEYVMTGLRTIWGVSLKKIEKDFGKNYANYIKRQAKKYLTQHLLFMDKGTLLATKKGKFLVDGIASNLFMVNLKS